MDTLLLSRIQFAVTIGFHFIFPPISIGLAWLLVIFETLARRRKDPDYLRLAQFFGKLLGITFVLGVATGIVMEFQFGTNWAEYSKFVGDIFGAPLAAEGVFAFFLESSFLGLYLFGRKKVSPGVHWFAGLMVAVGATISAFWILVANSWMQTPAGFVIQNGRAELTSFSQAVFNPSMWPRFFHTMTACMVCGAFFMAGIAAYLVQKNKEIPLAQKALKISLIMAFISSILVAFPFGHSHAQQVARTQPEKMASMEWLEKTQSRAPLLLFRAGDLKIAVPGMLSLLAYNDINATVQGLEEFPEDELPPLMLTFISFRIMFVLGTFFIFFTLLGVIQLYRKKLIQSPRYLRLLTWSIPLPMVAIQCGWIAAEVGRQPWIVYRQMLTRDAFSPTVSAGSVWFSLIMFCLIYLLLFSLYLFLVVRQVKQGPEPAAAKGTT
ncbi:cytochrome ubiquinol oxidase subunit I [Planctomycetota bacterium]